LESSAGDADDGATGAGNFADAPEDDASGTADAGTGGDASGTQDASADSGMVCKDAGDCIVVPSGWTLVAFAPTQASPCPSGFAQPTGVVEGPSATSACECGTCGVTTQPSCAGGPIKVLYDTITSAGAGTCDLPGTVTPLGNSPAGTCLTDLYKGDYTIDDLEYEPSGPSGGVCSAPGAKATAITYAAQDRICTAATALPSGCGGAVCVPALSSPYSACLQSPGDVACPAGALSTKHVVGTDTTFDCSACGCAVTGHCTGTVTLYADAECGGASLPVPANGSCNSVIDLSGDEPAASYNSYVYEGNAATGVACSTSGSSSAENVTLSNEATVCCAP
jgi:hypothetical protein